jgi:HAD superfamily hydrolase (TIGR01549 family)
MKLEEYLGKNKKKYLIFDFDSTLMNLHLPWGIFEKEIHSIIAKFDKGLLTGCKNKSAIHMRNKAIKKYGNKIRKIFCDYEYFFESKYYQGVTFNYELVDFIKKYHNKYHFFIWSSNSNKTIINHLKALKIDKFFNKIIALNHVDFSKPAADGFELIHKHSMGGKHEYLMVGDSIHDKNAAKKAGIDFFKVKPITAI